MSNITHFNKNEQRYGIEFIGPFTEEWIVTSDGYRVPKLTAIVKQDNTISLSLDHRFLVDCTKQEAEKWIWFIANAMAIGAGYSCHGENSVKDPNPFMVKITGLSEVPHD
jgi:hypothetical protein